MARTEQSPYTDWTPEKLKKEIRKLRKEREPLVKESTRINQRLNANLASMQHMQFMLICNSDLRETLRGMNSECI